MTHPTDAFRGERVKTYDMFRKVLDDEGKWTSARQAVANVFNAHFTKAMTISQIAAIATAVECLSTEPETQDRLHDAVKYFSRIGVLRQRRSQGRVLYEVNY